MSYVFSKALRETSEEREKRKVAPPKWTPPETPAKTAPPVAIKPKPVGSAITGTSHEAPVESGSSKAREAFRKTSLPTRSYSVDSDFGTGPKMGGAFARLQMKLQHGPDTKQGLYSDAYEAYKMRKSLKEHGVLPTNLRQNEQLRKYSLDKETPPVILPKPRTSSVENKRDAFARNRSMTTPTSPTGDFFNNTTIEQPSVFDENQEIPASTQAQTDVATVLTEKAEKPTDSYIECQTQDDPALVSSEPTGAIPVIKPDEIPPVKIDENTQSILDPTNGSKIPACEIIPSKPAASSFGDPTEIQKLEEAPEVIAMKEEIANEKTKMKLGQRTLSNAIDELENVDFEFDLSKKGEEIVFEEPEKETTEKSESEPKAQNVGNVSEPFTPTNQTAECVAEPNIYVETEPIESSPVESKPVEGLSELNQNKADVIEVLSAATDDISSVEPNTPVDALSVCIETQSEQKAMEPPATSKEYTPDSITDFTKVAAASPESKIEQDVVEQTTVTQTSVLENQEYDTTEVKAEISEPAPELELPSSANSVLTTSDTEATKPTSDEIPNITDHNDSSKQPTSECIESPIVTESDEISKKESSNEENSETFSTDAVQYSQITAETQEPTNNVTSDSLPSSEILPKRGEYSPAPEQVVHPEDVKTTEDATEITPPLVEEDIKHTAEELVQPGENEETKTKPIQQSEQSDIEVKSEVQNETPQQVEEPVPATTPDVNSTKRSENLIDVAPVDVQYHQDSQNIDEIINQAPSSNYDQKREDVQDSPNLKVAESPPQTSDGPTSSEVQPELYKPDSQQFDEQKIELEPETVVESSSKETESSSQEKHKQNADPVGILMPETDDNKDNAVIESPAVDTASSEMNITKQTEKSVKAEELAELDTNVNIKLPLETAI